jgi:spore germination cell wall hydrolase CwlJ-like protein
MANGDDDWQGTTLNSVPQGVMPWQFAQAPQMAPDDRDALIKTIAGEAGSEGPDGQAAVAHVVANRLAAGGYGNSVYDIVHAPAAGVNPKQGYHEFSLWNPVNKGGNLQPQRLDPSSSQYQAIGDIVDRVHNGEIPDPTGGATHYWARSMGDQPPRSWGTWGPLAVAQNRRVIGNQIFAGGASGPGQALTKVASGG